MLVESPDGKTRQININDAKPVSATAATNNALQDFKQSACKESILSHTCCKALLSKYMKQSSNRKNLENPENSEFRVFFFLFPSHITVTIPSLSHPALTINQLSISKSSLFNNSSYSAFHCIFHIINSLLVKLQLH